jgi:hypothetical protein
LGTLSVTADWLQMGISALQVISQGSCAFAKNEQVKAQSSSNDLSMIVLFLIPI